MSWCQVSGCPLVAFCLPHFTAEEAMLGYFYERRSVRLAGGRHHHLIRALYFSLPLCFTSYYLFTSHLCQVSGCSLVRPRCRATRFADL